MLFAIGTRVRFRYTGESGVITARLEDGMLQVRLNNDPDLEIPAFEEDLIRDSDAEPVLPGAKFVQGKKTLPPPPPPKREIKGQYIILKSKGVQIAFEPMPGRDGNVSRYKAWLVNDTDHEFLFDAELTTSTKRVFLVEGKLGATTALELGDVLYDDLSDALELDIVIRRITTEGPEAPLERLLKVRPKTFFNSFQTVPILNVLSYQFLLFDTFQAPPAQGNNKEDLRDYTKQMVRERRSFSEPDAVPYKAFDVNEFAHFEPEIDLHIEHLNPGYARLDRGEIVRIQLQHFHRFMEKAIRLGVPRVFIIHGVGEGKLRDAISDYLRHERAVVKFKNEFHAKYGYGATEVIFH
ncbi:MAG: Smr/MutS family protein [Saprospiraceae bacterium]|nr:Smr/MutS family protein [Saprospiraceae bacterium]